METLMIVLTFLIPTALLGLIIFFLYRFFRHGYVGNVYVYIVFTYLFCLALSIFVNLNQMPVDISKTIVENGATREIIIKGTNVSFDNPFQAIATSFFDSLKMMVVAFDKAPLDAYFAKKGWYFAFGVIYIISSILALVSTSVSVIIFSIKSFWAKFVNFIIGISPKTEVYYIFSEAKVAPAAKKLARVLRKQKHIVIMYVTKASLKTQEGTEYRDSLINERFDVRSEAFSEKLTSYMFRKYYYRTYGLRRLFVIPWIYRNRKVTVYGIFDDDDSAIDLADNFRKGIVKNYLFYERYGKYFPSNSNANDKTFWINQLDKRRHKALFGEEEKASKKVQSLNNKRTELESSLKKEVDEATKNQIQTKLKELDKTIKEAAEEYNTAVKVREGKEREFESKKKNDVINDLNFIKKYRVFVTYQECDIDIVHNFSGQTLHIVNTLSQYDMVSTEFVLNNPIVNFLPMKEEKVLGEKKMTIDLNDDNSDTLNVSFLGFGNINKPIFEKMTQAYQLWDDYGHKIHYHIYDYKSKDILEGLQSEYLEKPEKLDLDAEWEGEYFQKPQLYEVDDQCHGGDLTSYQVLEKNIKEIIANNKDKKRFNKNGFEIFIISARSTNSDIQIAKSLRHILIKHLDSEVLKNVYIFVRIGSETIADSVMREGANKYMFKQNDFEIKKDNAYIAPIVIFGENTNMSEFIDRDYETLVKLGKVASAAYDPNKPAHEIELEWVQMDKMGVLNNMATIYSLKTKLNIIGLDLRLDKRNWIISEKQKGKDGKYVDVPLSKEQYESIINRLDREVNFLQKIAYDVPMMKLARVEHNRWLATLYCLHKQGQMSKEEYRYVWIPKGKSRTPGRERHVCMTTNKGLRDVYKFAINHVLTDEEKKEKKPKLELSVDDAKKLTYDNDIAIMKKVFETIIELQAGGDNNAKK